MPACQVPGHVGVRMRVRTCSTAYAVCKAYAAYCDIVCGVSGSTMSFDIIS